MSVPTFKIYFTFSRPLIIIKTGFKNMSENIADKNIIGNSSNSVSADELAEEAGARIEASLIKARSTANLYLSQSLVDSVSTTTENIVELTKKSKAVNDSYGNPLSSVGTDDKVNSFTTYGFSADTLQWPLWLALYNDSWVFQRAIDKPATDMIAAGFTIHGNKNYDKIYKVYNRYKNQMNDLLKWGALFGGSIAVILFENVKNNDLSKPLNKNNIKGNDSNCMLQTDGMD